MYSQWNAAGEIKLNVFTFLFYKSNFQALQNNSVLFITVVLVNKRCTPRFSQNNFYQWTPWYFQIFVELCFHFKQKINPQSLGCASVWAVSPAGNKQLSCKGGGALSQQADKHLQCKLLQKFRVSLKVLLLLQNVT